MKTSHVYMDEKGYILKLICGVPHCYHAMYGWQRSARYLNLEQFFKAALVEIDPVRHGVQPEAALTRARSLKK